MIFFVEFPMLVGFISLAGPCTKGFSGCLPARKTILQII